MREVIYECPLDGIVVVVTNHVIEGDGVDDAEVLEVVLVGGIVTVPGNHVEGRVILVGYKQVTLKLQKNRFIRFFNHDTFYKEVIRK